MAARARAQGREVMATEAQRRAESAYRKKSVKQIVMRFYPGENDAELYEWIKSHRNVNEYLKSLVREDMQNSR